MMTKRAIAKRLATTATSVCCLGLVLGLVVPLISTWPCVLFEHFRIQYAVAGAITVIAAAALRIRGYFDVAAIAATVHFGSIVPDLARSTLPLPPDGVAVRVLVLNVHTESTSFAEVRDLIAEVAPDVVGLVEVDQGWLDNIAPAVAEFVGRIEQPRRDNFGVALYSRAPLDGTIEEFAAGLPSAVASTTIRGAQFSIVVTHPVPPVRSEGYRAQRAALSAAAERARTIAGPVMVIGDLNTTPWSRDFHQFIARSGLCDSRAGFGVQATFPANSLVLRIPIDHVLVTCSIGVADRRVERDVGSDHLPVVVDLVIPRAIASP